jgi:hypothetical protein
MRTPWWLSGLLVVLAAFPVQAQEQDENNLPSAPVLIEPEPPASPPPAVIESDPPAVIESEPPVVIESDPPVVVEPESVVPNEGVVEVSPRPALGVRFFRGSQIVLAEVLEDSPADLAGLQRGDRVISFNGTLPATTDEFIALVASASIDTTSQILVVRGGERHSIVVEPDAWNSVFTESHAAARPDLDVDLDDDGDPDVAAAVPSPPYYYAPYYWYAPYYYVSNVSPVVVPASWYVPYPYPYPYYYTAYWGYYPAWYYNAYVPGYYWPYYWNYPAYWGVTPHPHHHQDDEAPDQDSADLDSRSTVTVRYARP